MHNNVLLLHAETAQSDYNTEEHIITCSCEQAPIRNNSIGDIHVGKEFIVARPC